MKLAIIIEHYDASRGGAERLAAWVAREMARRGHEVHVICHDLAARVSRYRQATLRASFDAHRSRRHGAPGTESDDARIHVHCVRGMRLHTALGFRLFGRRAQALCRRKGFDVVHSFTLACAGDIYHAQAGVYAAMQAQAVAMHPGGSAAGRAWKRLLLRLGRQRTLLAMEKRALTEARRVISSCAMMTQQFATHYGTAGGRVLTLATPQMPDAEEGEGSGALSAAGNAEKLRADRAWFRGHYKLAETDRVAIFVGHDFRRKGLRQAIEAVARTRDWKLVVVGLGRVREYVELGQRLGLVPGEAQEGIVASPALPARVLFVGPTRELPAIYAAADALLLPAFYEPSGVVALEALGHGLPVVGSACLGVADLVLAYRAGAIVADPHDVAALAAGLQDLPAVDSAAGLALAERARSAAASLAPADYTDRLEKLYREVAGRK